MEKFIANGNKFVEFYFNAAFVIFGGYALVKSILYLINL